MNRRGFLASLIAVAVAPHVPVPQCGYDVAPVTVLDESGVDYEWPQLTHDYLRPAVAHLIAERDRFLLETYRRYA